MSHASETRAHLARAAGAAALAAVVALILCAAAPAAARAQTDTTRAPARDSTQAQPPRRDPAVVQDAIYARPFIADFGRTAVGGYVEGNTNYFVEDGIAEGFSMELRRFNIFLFSSLGQRLRFLSELEFEHGTEEIAIETALLDFRISPALVLRGGIILPPIGAFNQNHDSPRWDFVDRPLVSTEIIPSTLAEVGAGVNGKLYPRVGRAAGRGARRWARGLTVSYDAYVTNGLGEGVVLNEQGRTHLASGRREEQFAGDNNGSPAVSGRVAVRTATLGEVGVSYYGGAYNSFRVDGQVVDERRRVSLAALDLSTAVGPVSVRGEAALARVDVPDDLTGAFGDRQWGAHLDLVAPVWRPRWRGLPGAVVSTTLRLERVDYNVGTFASTGRRVYDELSALVAGVSVRPAAGTVLRANYRRHWYRDLAGNPTIHRGGYQVGLATYF